MADRFLDKVYTLGADTPTEVLYREWAATYDAEVTEAGYATPGRAAEALASVVDDKAAPILDMGCGTGLSGIALRSAGFEVIDGVDLTQEMLDQAGRLTLYRELRQTDVSDPLPFASGTHAHVAAIGLFSPSHAPAGTVDLVLRYLSRGGCFVFSLNDHALADPTYEGVIRNWVDCGAARVLFKEYGDHLPSEDIKSVVYVLQKS
ncbi:putative TPR repeat methyltransferase [Rubricella aquisinus]|uniref:Putative TPR repeat methyltransferase n=1 Tax=Rubricella aquisinus TaxID=2028108 RepID=A0A840WWY1_9RHOB|nr:methyltransferase domain-containing protein [Rubricella aquisinus]MBB5514844.1 putative TPR repeat methyltransferase [Rubricella aquisinus]